MKDKIYLLYVCNTINASSVQMMESYCVGDHLCAIINVNSSNNEGRC